MTKREAIQKAQELRAEGKQVKVLREEGIHTIPGRGIVGYITYRVVEVS